MAFSHGKSSKVYVNGYDLTSYFNHVSMPASQETAEVTTFGKNNKVKIAGVGDGTLSAEGVYDPATGAQDPVLRASLGVVGQIWSWLPAGDVFGSPALCASVIGSGYEPDGSIDDAVTFSTEAECDTNAVEACKILKILDAQVATGNDTTEDNAAGTTNGAVFFIHVTAIAGAAPSVTFEVRHSTDNFGASNDLLGTFTVVTAANQKERLLIAAGTTVHRYIRIRRIFGGTTTSITYFVAGRRN